MPNIAVLGAGRMGTLIAQVVSDHPRCSLAGIWSHRSGNLEQLLAEADVAIDFTLPAATATIVTAVLSAGKPLVCGVSGLKDEQQALLKSAASEIPVLYDRNMSVGIAVLKRLVEIAGATLGNDFRAEIHETHHIHKLDAPSGTALLLGEALAESRGQELADVYRFGAESRSSGNDAIEFFSERRGEVPGDHRVTFSSSNETLSLAHSVSDRRVFAEGAVHAAEFLVAQAPGYYRMSDAMSDALRL